MLGLFRRRWVWGIVGALVTSYLVREAKKQRGFLASRDGMANAMDGLMRAGRALVDRTMHMAKMR